MRKLRTLADVTDFMAAVVLRAPDNFSPQDYLRPEEQMNLDRAFERLREGMDLIVAEVDDESAIKGWRGMVEEAYTHYRAGRIKEGAWKLQELMRLMEKL